MATCRLVSPSKCTHSVYVRVQFFSFFFLVQLRQRGLNIVKTFEYFISPFAYRYLYGVLSESSQRYMREESEKLSLRQVFLFSYRDYLPRATLGCTRIAVSWSFSGYSIRGYISRKWSNIDGQNLLHLFINLTLEKEIPFNFWKIMTKLLRSAEWHFSYTIIGRSRMPSEVMLRLYNRDG